MFTTIVHPPAPPDDEIMLTPFPELLTDTKLPLLSLYVPPRLTSTSFPLIQALARA